MASGFELLPVHCCRQPWKRIGWVPVGPYVRGAWMQFAVTPAYRRNGERQEPHTITTMVAALRFRDGSTLDVVQNANEPIEVWREVPGFIEELREQRGRER